MYCKGTPPPDCINASRQTRRIFVIGWYNDKEERLDQSTHNPLQHGCRHGRNHLQEMHRGNISPERGRGMHRISELAPVVWRLHQQAKA